MLNYNEVDMNLNVYPVKLEDGKIIQEGTTAVKSFDPFADVKRPNGSRYKRRATSVKRARRYKDDQGCTPLYREFIKIDETNDDEVFAFIKNYGFLGLNSLLRRTMKQESLGTLLEAIEALRETVVEMVTQGALYFSVHERGSGEPLALINDFLVNGLRFPSVDFSKVNEVSLTTADNPLGKALDSVVAGKTTKYSESLDDIKSEIIRMKFIASLWDSLTRGEEGADTVLDIRHALARAISEQIAHVRPYLTDSKPVAATNYQTKHYALAPGWDVPDLLSAMYIRIYSDVSQGKMLRKCKSETCPDWFELKGGYSRQRYCNDTCSGNQRKRDQRRRKKGAPHGLD